MALGVLTACDDAPAVVPDSGTADAAMDGGLAGALPEPPRMDCPSGWRAVPVGGMSACEPYPEGGVQSCPPGEAHFVGEAACRSVGDPCPPGELPDGLPTDTPVLFVDDDATAPGDGTRGSPYPSLSVVPWSSLSSGTTVALAKGIYSGTLPLKAGVRVVGACAKETILTGVAAPVLAVINVTSLGEAASVENLAIRDAPQRGATLDGGSALSLEGVIIEGAQDLGLSIFDAGSTASLTDVVIRDTRHHPDGFIGRAINAESGARVTSNRLILSGNYDTSIVAIGEGTTIELSDTVIRDTRRSPADDAGGNAIAVNEGARLEASRSLFVGNQDVALIGFGGRALLTDVVIRDTAGLVSQRSGGRAISFQEESVIDATRLFADGYDGIGVYGADPGTTINLVDSVLRTMSDAPSPAGYLARGINSELGATVNATRVLIVGHGGNSVFTHSEGSQAVLTDVTVRSVVGQPRGEGALWAQRNSTLTGTRVLIEGTSYVGVGSLTGAVVEVSDLTTENVDRGCIGTTCDAPSGGYAIAAISGIVRLTNFRVNDAELCGVFIAAIMDGAAPPEVDLSHGAVSGSPIGACLQVDGYDLDRLTNDVVYFDNGSNLDSTMLPVPQPASSPGS